MSWVAVGVAAVAGLSMLSQQNAKQDQEEQEVATNKANASQSIANMQAVEAQASAQELATRAASQQYLGRQRAALADSGTGSLGSGSNFDIGKQSAVAAEMDALNVRYSGELKGADYLQSAYNYEYGADVSQSNADAIGRDKYATAGVTALSSFAGSYGRGASIKNPGTGAATYGGL